MSPVSTIQISLNGGEHAAVTRADGTFAFHDVSPGDCFELPPACLARDVTALLTCQAYTSWMSSHRDTYIVSSS